MFRTKVCGKEAKTSQIFIFLKLWNFALLMVAGMQMFNPCHSSFQHSGCDKVICIQVIGNLKERKKDKRTYLMLQLLGNLEMVQTNYKLHLKISLFFKKNFQSIRFYFWLIGSSLLFVTSSNKSSCNLNLQVTNFCQQHFHR